VSRIDPDQKVEGDYKADSTESAQPFSFITILVLSKYHFLFSIPYLTLHDIVLFFFQTSDEGHSKNQYFLNIFSNAPQFKVHEHSYISLLICHNMWERVKKLSSTNNDAVRVTLSSDSKEISEKMKQSESDDQIIDSTINGKCESSETQIEEAEVVEISKDKDESEQMDNDTETIESDTAEVKEEEEQEYNEDEKKQDVAEEMDKTVKENKDLQDRLLRLSAEFENFKKRNRREMSEFKKFASEVLIKDLLPVVDNLDRALETASTDEACKAINEGVSMTRDEMLKVFSKYGVQPVEALEKDFDPAFHQAVGQEEDAESPKNKVLKEYQKGYTIHGRLLRPSMVIVSS